MYICMNVYMFVYIYIYMLYIHMFLCVYIYASGVILQRGLWAHKKIRFFYVFWLCETCRNAIRSCLCSPNTLSLVSFVVFLFHHPTEMCSTKLAHMSLICSTKLAKTH